MGKSQRWGVRWASWSDCIVSPPHLDVNLLVGLCGGLLEGQVQIGQDSMHGSRHMVCCGRRGQGDWHTHFRVEVGSRQILWERMELSVPRIGYTADPEQHSGTMDLADPAKASDRQTVAQIDPSLPLFHHPKGEGAGRVSDAEAGYTPPPSQGSPTIQKVHAGGAGRVSDTELDQGRPRDGHLLRRRIPRRRRAGSCRGVREVEVGPRHP